MKTSRLISPEDQSVTFVELFFDLVFVFSLTQIVGILHHGIDLLTIGQSLLVFWLVWWAWTQYTWALNAADTNHYYIQMGTLLATGVAFFMAVAVPYAFEDGAIWFAVSYVILRSLGLVLYALVASENPKQRSAVRLFTLASMGGLVAVIAGGIAGGSTQYWLWGLAIFLDIIAAEAGGQAEGWDLHPEHFTERHGLFVIIALGETLIVAASGVTGGTFSDSLILVALFAVATTCTLWWTYFPRTKPLLDASLEKVEDAARSMMARDVFSLIHFPMLCGVVACAAVLAQAISHPDDPLDFITRATLAVGIFLFVGGVGVAVWRASRLILIPRFVVIAITAGMIAFISGLPPYASLSIAIIGTMLVVVTEHRDHRLPSISGEVGNGT